MTRDERQILTRRQFLFYLKCLSLRQTAKYFDTPRSVLIYRFQTYLHPSYAKLTRQGVCGEMRRYLVGNKYSDRKKEEIEQWLLTNLTFILETDSKHGVDFHTESTANKLTKRSLQYFDNYAY